MDGIDIARAVAYKMQERKEISVSESPKIGVGSEREEERCSAQLRYLGHLMRDHKQSSNIPSKDQRSNSSARESDS